MKSRSTKIFLLLFVTVLFFVLSSCWSSEKETPTPVPPTKEVTQPQPTATATVEQSVPTATSPDSPLQVVSPLQSISPLQGSNPSQTVVNIAADPNSLTSRFALNGLENVIQLDVKAQLNLFRTGGMKAEDFLKLGPVLLSEAKYEDALALYTNLINEDPKSIVGYHGRGNILALLNRYDEALLDYTTAINLEPTNELFVSRCKTYSTMHRFEEAHADCNHVLSSEPNNVEALVALSHLYLREKNTGEAKLIIDRALTIQETAEAHYLAALIALDEGDNLVAVDHLSNSIGLEPSQPQYYWDRAMTYLGLGKVEECKEDLQTLIDIGNPAMDGELMFKAGSQLKFLTGD